MIRNRKTYSTKKRITLICVGVIFLFIGIGIIKFIYDIHQYTLQSPISNANKCMETLAMEACYQGEQYPSSLDQIKTDPRLKVDPWGTPFQYQLLSNGCSLACAGPDKKFGTADDIVRTFTWDSIRKISKQ